MITQDVSVRDFVGSADGGGRAGVPQPAAAGDDIVVALPAAPVQGGIKIVLRVFGDLSYH